jgi:hypothetical protein
MKTSLLLASCFVVALATGIGEVGAQVPERVRIETGVVLAGESFRWVGGPLTPPVGGSMPTDGLILFDLSTTVNVTERLQVGAGAQAALALNPGDGLFVRAAHDAGWGDTSASVHVTTIRERLWVPGVQVSGHVTAPTATLRHLQTDAWSRTARATLSKSFHPRFWTWGSASHSDFVGRNGLTITPLRSWGGGVGIGITRASILQLGIEEFAGAERNHEGQQLSSAVRDGQLTMTMTRFSRGRPRTSLILGLAGLRRDSPTYVIGVRRAVASF